jgi:hypothetical protein
MGFLSNFSLSGAWGAVLAVGILGALAFTHVLNLRVG